ncbi:MAG: hypothetical protein M1838_004080 [Thelocarpon superellum]|nr:MAG: hypothetical protein M1838_004080 [Thelocarpon superellum]
MSSLEEEKQQDGPETRSTCFGILGHWRSEIFSALVVVSAILALIFTLIIYQDQPLPQLPLNISVNTLVAVYVVVLKTAILLIITEGLSQLKWIWYTQPRPLQDLSQFDLASRGPWGALVLIGVLRGRHLVATIGALVILVCLVLDPLSQLLVVYYNCPSQLPDTLATIPRTNAFGETGRHIGAGVTTLNYDYQSAINAGLFSPESVSISFACPTGNCTFPETYQTLGYCSSCVDLTPALNTSCGYVNSTVSSLDVASNSTVNSTSPTWQCNSSLPGGFSAISRDDDQGDIDYFNMQGPSGGNSSMQIIAMNLTNIYSGNCSTKQENATWPCMGHGAASCTLSPCVRSYQAAINNGKLEETVVSTSAEWARDNALESSVTLDVDCLSPAVRKSLIDVGYTINASTRWLGYMGNDTFGNGTMAITNGTGSLPNISIPDACTYAIYEQTSTSLGYFTSTFFNGTVTQSPESSYDYATTGSVQLQKFFNDGNVSLGYINDTFADIADSMTAYIRQSTRPARTGHSLFDQHRVAPAVGQVWQANTCVRVQWGYAIVPMVLGFFTLLFLVATMAETGGSQHQRMAWKSSPLALLFHGLDPYSLTTANAAREDEIASVSDMRVLAKQMRVCLRRTERGWQFVELL